MTLLETFHSMASLNSLPYELLFHIFSQCSPQDLCHLSYTCKKLASVANSCLWSDIELHDKGYHESSAELNEPPPFRSAERPYNSSKREGWQSDIYKRAKGLFTMFQTLHTRDERRLRQLTSRVRNLCTVVEPGWCPNEREVANPTSVWNILPYFTSLESLELHGTSDTSPNVDSGLLLRDAPPLADLKFARLFAYIPNSVATYVLRSSESIERLELGMLDSPKPSHVGIGSNDNTNDEGGEVSQRGVIPRPLGGFFPRRGDYFNQRNSWSAHAEKASLESWANILMASCHVVETLVLDQRPGAEIEENEGFSEEEFLNTGRSGAGNKALVEALGGIITSESALPQLKQVYLYGFIVGSSFRRSPSTETPGDRLLRSLQSRGVGYEARRGKWCLFDQASGTTTWAKWDGDGRTDLHDGYMGIKWYTVLAKA
ncbi:hypothetical protein ACLX1H_000307 [Fusarium chlamydosporum]